MRQLFGVIFQLRLKVLTQLDLKRGKTFSVLCDAVLCQLLRNDRPHRRRLIRLACGQVDLILNQGVELCRCQFRFEGWQ